MSASHLAMVRKLPCCVCGIIGRSHAHHLLRTEEHGLSRKSSDKWALPLCEQIGRPGCHKGLHDDGDEEGYLAKHGIDGRALASALWACRNDDDPLSAMERVVFRFRQEAALKRRMG